MRFDNFSFGTIRIDGVTYEKDVVIDRGNRIVFAFSLCCLSNTRHSSTTAAKAVSLESILKRF
jgi:hypothetical protein